MCGNYEIVTMRSMCNPGARGIVMLGSWRNRHDQERGPRALDCISEALSGGKVMNITLAEIDFFNIIDELLDDCNVKPLITGPSPIFLKGASGRTWDPFYLLAEGTPVIQGKPKGTYIYIYICPFFSVTARFQNRHHWLLEWRSKRGAN